VWEPIHPMSYSQKLLQLSNISRCCDVLYADVEKSFEGYLLPRAYTVFPSRIVRTTRTR
jgi:hypothetical protein